MRKKRLPLLKKEQRCYKEDRKTIYQLLEIYQRRSYQRKLLWLITLIKVDKVLCKFKTQNITKTNELFYAGAVVATNMLGAKVSKAAERKEPMRRRRLQNKIKALTKDLSQLESSKDKEVSNARHGKH